MVFCNKRSKKWYLCVSNVTILILIDGFLQYSMDIRDEAKKEVTILILIDGFLQCIKDVKRSIRVIGHNPYFNRWFSAIWRYTLFSCRKVRGHNPYFNRWFSAIWNRKSSKRVRQSHNPYFNRWFSAISILQRKKHW